MRICFFIFFILVVNSSWGQLIRGFVLDEQQESVPFAKIQLKNTSFGTLANANGRYQLELSKGTHILICSASGYQTAEITVEVTEELSEVNLVMSSVFQETEEVTIVYKSDRDKGKEIMQQVISRRSFFNDQLKRYKVDSYCLSSLEKDKFLGISADSLIGKEKLNLKEWKAISYYQSTNRFKDVFYAYQDFMEQPDELSTPTTVSFNIDLPNDNIVPTYELNRNPYIFINGIQDFHFSIFENAIDAPKLTTTPILSPLAFNALIHYKFYLENSFYDRDGSYVHAIRVEPRFKRDALFSGMIYVRNESWELVSYELSLPSSMLVTLQNLTIICDYEKQGEALVPKRREFIYTIREGGELINGFIRLKHEGYQFDFDDSGKRFWQQTQVYQPEAFDRSKSFWEQQRPIPLRDYELQFANEQDSIMNYQESEAYLRKRDSIRNTFRWLDLFFSGIGRVNSLKGYELYVPGLINQTVPFGVGGYRHKLDPIFTRRFENGKWLRVGPSIDYGFFNRDLRGGLHTTYMFDPLHFTELGFTVGDSYDFITGNQNIQGMLAPANRVRNQKLEIHGRRELVNGLFAKLALHYSDRTSIDAIEYPSWVNIFGDFQTPQPFNRYTIFLANLDVEYQFRQRYILKKGRKYILPSPWPTVRLQYRKALPSVFGAEANFDYYELRIHDDINWKRFGRSEVRANAGGFIQKQDLRIIEHKFFRPSDLLFFSNPITSLQLLDTALNTSNNYVQLNFIHHFNGLFLNKVWGINKLRLEESIGGSLLFLDNNQFVQAELYAGVQRTFRIRKSVFKLGVFAVSQANSISTASIRLKLGVNMYNSFNDRWDY